MTILVIDDDPLIASLIQALDPTWHVISALDGLLGLDILRRSIAEGSPPDLILLDIHMPGFDGYDTCILIRSILPTVPIVPFTQARDDDRLPRYMQELHCTHPIYKGIDPSELFQRLSTAMYSSPVPLSAATSAVFDRLLQKARESQQQARAQQASSLSIGLFAPSVVHQLGLKHLLETVCDLPLTIMPISDTPDDIARVGAARHILVASTADSQRAFALRQAGDCPLLLIAHTFHDGAGVAKATRKLPLASAVGVVLADHTVIRHVPAALRVLAAGQSHAEPILRHENAVRISRYIAEQQMLPQLSSRLAELTMLDFLGWTAAQMSDHFQVTLLTVETYWSRVAERLGGNREAARRWVRQCVERQDVVDRLRDYLETVTP